MERLEMLCKVIGSNFEEKLDEIGLVRGQEADGETDTVLEKHIDLLEQTRSSRFDKLKTLGLKLTDLWKLLNTPATEIIKFPEVLICVDASTASEFTNEKSLTVGVINKVTEEIAYLENCKVVKLKNRYLSKKNKLLKMIKESHQLPAEFNFDPKGEVSDFPEATAELKTLIGQVKVQAFARKEILMRTEVLLEAVKQPLPAKTAERLLRALESLLSNQGEFLYDGRDIKLVLIDIEAQIKREELPVKKRAARQRDQNTKGAELPDLPPLPYPSGVRGGHRSCRNQTWGKKPSK